MFIEYISASDYHVPLIITFKGAYHLRKYFKNEIDNNILFSRSDSGFVNDKLTFCWLKHFNDFTEKQTVRRYRMLIFDGYESYITQDFLDFCWEYYIWPF
jgi:hypothetical protein